MVKIQDKIIPLISAGVFVVEGILVGRGLAPAVCVYMLDKEKRGAEDVAPYVIILFCV